MNQFSPDDLYNATVYDRDGSKVGRVQQVYLDDATGSPSWITVNTGFFGTNESLVPLEGAGLNEDLLKVPFDKQQIKDAPNYDPGHHLDERDEDDLYRHYGLTGGAAAGTGLTDRDRDGRLGRDRDDRGFDPLDRDNDGQRFDDPDHGRSGRDRDRGFDPLDRDNDGQRFDDPNRGDLRDRDRDALRAQQDREGDRGLGPAVGAGAAGAAAGAAGAGMAGRGDRDRGRDRDGDWDRDGGRGRDDRGFDPLDRDNDGERFDDPNRGRTQDRLTGGHEGEPLDPQQGGGLRDTSRHDSGGLGRGGDDDQALQRERELLERERELLERDKELLNREQGRGRLRRHDRGQGY